MSKAKVKAFLIIFAVILSAPTWAGAYGASDGWNLSQSWPWFDGLLWFTWHATPLLTAATVLYVLISFIPLDSHGDGYWLAFGWLVVATLSLMCVVAIYLTAYKCGNSLSNFLHTAPPNWMLAWSILITFMMVSVSSGAALGKDDKQLMQSKSWKSLFGLAGSFIAIWTCILSTFGITIWNILPACP